MKLWFYSINGIIAACCPFLSADIHDRPFWRCFDAIKGRMNKDFMICWFFNPVPFNEPLFLLLLVAFAVSQELLYTVQTGNRPASVHVDFILDEMVNLGRSGRQGGPSWDAIIGGSFSSITLPRACERSLARALVVPSKGVCSSCRRLDA